MRVEDLLDRLYKEPMRSAAEIIDLWPSRADLARDLDVSYQTVSKWRLRRSIPPVYWKRLLISASTHAIPNVTAMALVDAHAGSPQGEVLAETLPVAPPIKADGHFTRYRHLARPRFKSISDVNAHLATLRDE